MTRAFFQGPKGHKERGRLSPAYQFTASQLLCQRWLHSPKNTAIDGTHTIHFCDGTEAKKPTLKFLSFFLNISLNLISHRSLIFGIFPPLDFFLLKRDELFHICLGHFLSCVCCVHWWWQSNCIDWVSSATAETHPITTHSRFPPFPVSRIYV